MNKKILSLVAALLSPTAFAGGGNSDAAYNRLMQHQYLVLMGWILNW